MSLFAVVDINGSQEIVKESDMVQVHKLTSAAGKGKVSLEKILMLFSADGSTVELGMPALSGKKIDAKVVTEDYKSDKVMGAKFKRRKRYTRVFGHRQRMTKLQVEKIG